MNRLSILVGWLTLTVIAIGVSSAAVGSVGERVSPQPASVLEAAGDIVALGAGDGDTSTTRATAPPTSTVIDPGDAATAPPPTSVPSTTGPSGVTTTAVSSSTTDPGQTTTTTGGPADTTTTTVHDGTTTTIVDGSTTTTTPPTTTTTPVEPTTTTTTIPEDEIERRTIDSKGGWIRIAWTDQWLRLGAAGPRAGFKLEVVENTGRRIVVRFASRSLDHVSRIVVRLIDGDAKVEVSEFSPDR